MAIRLSGILRDPFGATSPRTSIQVTSITTFGDTLMSAIAVHQTNDNGQYDFNLVAGRHKLEVRYQYEYVKVGEFFVGSDQTGTFTISQAMDLVIPPSDPALAEMRRILDQVNQATLGLDADVLAAAQSAQQAANAVLVINGVQEQVEGFRDQASEFAFNAEQSAIRAEAAADNAEGGGGVVGGGVNISIAGQSYASRGRFTTWEITDFDEFSPYEVSTPDGTTGVINGRFLTIHVPDEFTGDNIAFSIKRDTFSRSFVVRVVDIAIERPSITSPVNGDTNVHLFPVVAASDFNSDPLSIIHTQTEWQVSTSPLFNDLVINSGIVGASSQLDVKQYLPDGLTPNVVYFVRVRYYGVESGNQIISEWSNASGFTIQTTSMGVWQRTGTYPVDLINGILKTVVKIGNFLVAINIGTAQSTIFVYNKAGSVVSERTLALAVSSQGLADLVRVSASIEKDDPTGGNVHIVTVFAPNGVGVADFATLKISGVTGAILNNLEVERVTANGNFTQFDYDIGINSYIQLGTGEFVPHVILPESDGYYRNNNPFSEFLGTPSEAAVNVEGLLTKTNHETVCALRYANQIYPNTICKAFKINLDNGDTWTGQQVTLATNPAAGGDLPEVKVNITPTITNEFNGDLILSSVIKSPEFLNEGKDVVLIFNPNPASTLSTPMYVDLGGNITEGKTLQWLPVTETNKPDLTNIAFLEYAAHSVTKPDSPNDSNLQIVVRLEDSVQVWEMNLGAIM